MNNTTLNMTTLDGGVIIKKGEGGGGVTINNQDKVVDITENGTTEVVADGGYTGLGKVTINTEVSGGESGGSTIEYLDVSGLEQALKGTLAYFADAIKGSMGEDKFTGLNIGATRMVMGGPDSTPITFLALGIDFSRRTKMMSGGNTFDATIIELLSRIADKSVFDAIPRLTKEEFYTLD